MMGHESFARFVGHWVMGGGFYCLKFSCPPALCGALMFPPPRSSADSDCSFEVTISKRSGSQELLIWCRFVQFPLSLKLVQISGVQTSHGRLTLHISFGQQVPGLGLVTAKVRRSTLQGRSLQNLAEKTLLNLAPELSDPEKNHSNSAKLSTRSFHIPSESSRATQNLSKSDLHTSGTFEKVLNPLQTGSKLPNTSKTFWPQPRTYMGGPLFFEKEAATLQFLKTQALTNTWQFESIKNASSTVFLCSWPVPLQSLNVRMLGNFLTESSPGN